MDDVERRVLRRRKPYLTDCIRDYGDLLLTLRAAELLTHAQVKQVESEVANGQRMYRLLEFVCTCQVPGAFDIFCNCLKNLSQSAAKNIEADLRMEKGQVKVEVDNQREAGLLVHRKFGSSKRVSEGEKRGMQDYIGKKLQIVKDEYRTQTSALQIALERERETSHLDRSIAAQLSTQLRSFNKEHSHHLKTHAHDMITTRETLSGGETNELRRFQMQFKTLLERIGHVFTYFSAIEEDRDKCMKILKINDKNTNLSPVLSKVVGLSENAGLQVPGGRTDSGQERVLQQQRSRIFDLEEQLTEYETVIQELTNKINAFEHSKMNDLSKAPGTL